MVCFFMAFRRAQFSEAVVATNMTLAAELRGAPAVKSEPCFYRCKLKQTVQRNNAYYGLEGGQESDYAIHKRFLKMFHDHFNNSCKVSHLTYTIQVCSDNRTKVVFAAAWSNFGIFLGGKTP